MVLGRSAACNGSELSGNAGLLSSRLEDSKDHASAPRLLGRESASQLGCEAEKAEEEHCVAMSSSLTATADSNGEEDDCGCDSLLLQVKRLRALRGREAADTYRRQVLGLPPADPEDVEDWDQECVAQGPSVAGLLQRWQTLEEEAETSTPSEVGNYAGACDNEGDDSDELDDYLVHVKRTRAKRGAEAAAAVRRQFLEESGMQLPDEMSSSACDGDLGVDLLTCDEL
eukprot:TRINITY_DN48311_c0_g1_i1.p1 TRINITY_DN48311_c0_g1~~TRINITY_DN48311_c0_g1_i1.p1  ORF type:complete len:263 (-),score=76.47 TRINITY_DN48311_c0_g1_i1:58-741(-)